MTAFQSIAEHLLLTTQACRVAIELTDEKGRGVAVAEAVRADLRQLRHDTPAREVLDDDARARLRAGRDLLVQDDLARLDPALCEFLWARYGVRSRLVAPFGAGGQPFGAIVMHGADGAMRWRQEDKAALEAARERAESVLQTQEGLHVPSAVDQLRSSAIQAVLDTVRQRLRVQRCTLRRNDRESQALPVTHESRGEGVRALLGDFTIDQRQQPVVKSLMARQAQVVQHDTRSASPDPVFQNMLAHYGDMRAQIVTPIVRNDGLVGVLSIHYLGELRDWTGEETTFARAAAELLGQVSESRLF